MQLFSVAISWGNKINFSLYANMAGFLLRQSHIIAIYHMLSPFSVQLCNYAKIYMTWSSR